MESCSGVCSMGCVCMALGRVMCAGGGGCVSAQLQRVAHGERQRAPAFSPGTVCALTCLHACELMCSSGGPPVQEQQENRNSRIHGRLHASHDHLCSGKFGLWLWEAQSRHELSVDTQEESPFRVLGRRPRVGLSGKPPVDTLCATVHTEAYLDDRAPGEADVVKIHTLNWTISVS